MDDQGDCGDRRLERESGWAGDVVMAELWARARVEVRASLADWRLAVEISRSASSAVALTHVEIGLCEDPFKTLVVSLDNECIA